MFPLIFSLIIFVLVLLVVTFEWFDKSIAALSGVIILLIAQVITPGDIVSFIDYETIFLLFGMMVLVDTAKSSEVFSWLNVRITHLTKGNPLLILIFFLGMTAFFSAFLANVTTIMIVVPITIALAKGMGFNPRLYVIFEIIVSNIGGTLTLIGDPPNVMIGSAVGFSFMDFIINLWIPILSILVLICAILIIKYWHIFKPINDNIPKLFSSNLLIEQVKHKFGLLKFNKKFAIQSAIVVFLTIVCLIFPDIIGISTEYIVIAGALILLLISKKSVSFDSVLRGLEWNTLIFFSGLFILVGALEKAGALEYISEFMVHNAHSTFGLMMLILWGAGMLSGFMDNIPFVAVMIPVIEDIIASGSLDGDTSLLWWALSLGACLGGNGTLLGSSPNLVAVAIARKEGVNITFMDYFKYGMVVTVGSLIVSSIYLYFRASV